MRFSESVYEPILEASERVGRRQVMVCFLFELS